MRRDLSPLYLGKTLGRISVTGPRTVRRHEAGRLAVLEGQALSGIGRHGKFLLFSWTDGAVMVAHLRMSGQLLAAAAGTPLVPHTHAVLEFQVAPELRFVDPRTFGELFIATPRPGQVPAELAHLGPDALVTDARHLGSAFRGRKAAVKALLVDQRVLAGVGNIYADEICFTARVRPDRPAGSLRPREVGRLAEATRDVLAAAIAARGSTLGDQRYRDLHGEVGRYQLEHRAYGRAGMPCVTCGRPITRFRIGAKSAFACTRCQR